MPTLVNSSPFDFAQGRQFIVHGNAATVNREPLTVNRRPWRRGFHFDRASGGHHYYRHTDLCGLGFIYQRPDEKPRRPQKKRS